MGTLTKGPISVYPMKVMTELSIEESFPLLSNAAAQASESAGGIDSRWGSATDTADELVGMVAVRPAFSAAPGRLDEVAVPVLDTRRAGESEADRQWLLSSENYVTKGVSSVEPIEVDSAASEGKWTSIDVLTLRLYWYELERHALEVLHNVEPLEYHRLKAADIIITQGVEDATHTVLVTSRNSRAINRFVVPAIREVYSSVDESALVYPDSSSMELGDGDIFLWLLARAHHQPAVTSDLDVTAVRSVNSEAKAGWVSALSRGVDIGRLELLALIATRTTLGPAKITLRDSLLGLNADVELFGDGGFGAILGESWYSDAPMSRVEIGPRLVNDLAFSTIPRLVDAYNRDAHWRSVARDKYVANALDVLRSI